VIILTFTAGSALMMWLGEQVNQYGIGNGISILLFAGIIANLPTTFGALVQYFQLAAQGGAYLQYYFTVPIFLLLFVAVIVLIVVMNDAERRIPVQYAKMMKGRKMYGGQSTFIPIKVGMNGVLPIIFASSILSIPSTIQIFTAPKDGTFWKSFFDVFNPNGGWVYMVLYFFFIILFAFFYVSIQYNPQEMSNNLRKNNGTVPGIRPGKPTTDFISRILSKVTFIGALFLAVIALLPLIYGKAANMAGLTMGGTSVIIIVGVALETMRQIESQMMVRHYKGFLD
jgi:preprotein translocase subunit SecY